uniref:Putative tigger transposable element n=1 Tax=Amblyomma aureolatum TaxID=187763 RepID=A0A1E1X318_9ACAR
MASRKRKALSLQEKLDALNAVDRQPARKRIDIAKDLGLPPSTLNSIVSKRAEIEGNAALFGPKAKQARGAKYGNLDEALLTWFKQARAAGVNFDGSILREKAVDIADRLGITDFAASNGWIDRFRKRHGIAYKTVSGESASVNLATVDDWKATLSAILIEGYAPRDIYNADETGLFFRVQPSKSLSLKGEACHGGKNSKERLTVLLCCNMDGSDKLKPWVIGKYRNPRCLKNTRLLPCHYRSNSRAWMTCSLFEEFLRYFDNKMGSQCRSVLLFLDNCAAHPRDPQFLRNVKLVFFPPNTTSHLQPLDAGVIKNLKHSYRKCVVKRCLARIDRGQQPTTISVLDAMHYVASAWAAVAASTAQHCFAQCGFRTDGEGEFPGTDAGESEAASCDQELTEAMDALGATGLTYDDYVAVDAAVVTSECQSIGDIVASSVASEAADCDDELEPHDSEDLSDPSFGEAVAALDLLRRYVAPQSDADSNAAFQAIEKRLVFSSERKKRQSTILDFFKS